MAGRRAGSGAASRIRRRSSGTVLWWQAAAAAASALPVVGIPGVLAGLWMARSIAAAGAAAAPGVAEAIAEDLTGSVPAGAADEVGRLLGSVDRMVHSLSGLIGRIQHAGERLSSVESDTAEALARQDRAGAGSQWVGDGRFGRPSRGSRRRASNCSRLRAA